MKTIKLPYKTVEESTDLINKLRRQQSCVIRWSYNRSLEGLSQKEMRDQVNSLNNINLLDTWFIQSGIVKGKDIFTSEKQIKNINIKKIKKSKDHDINDKERIIKRIQNKRVIFGGKGNLKKRSSSQLSKEEWINKRIQPLHIVGETPQKGNRKFNLKINESIIQFKPKKGILIDLKLPNLKRNYRSELLELQKLAEQKEISYTISLDDKNIFISFELNEEKRLESIMNRAFTKNDARLKAKEKLENLKKATLYNPLRVMGLDLNPNYIGVSIIDFDKDNKFKIIYKEVIDFSDLNNKENYNPNKKKHETIETCKYIVNLCKYMKCSKLSIEELTIESSDKRKGKFFNRACNNVFHRELINQQLKKRCTEYKIELVEVNPAYSSTIGNIQYGCDNCPDMVASSIEVARRGFKKFLKGWFYPQEKNIDNLKNLWKEEVDWSSLTWKSIHKKLIKSKVKYRFPLLPERVGSRFSSNKANICRHLFTNVHN